MTSHLAQSHLAQDLLDLMTDALVVIDEDQRIVQVNPQAEKLFELSWSQMLGQPLEVLVPAEAREAHRQKVQRFEQSPELVRMLEERKVLSGRSKSGKSFSFLGTIAKLYLPEGLRMAIMMHDVSDFLRAEHLRQRVERALYCMSQCLSAVIQAEEENALLQEVCEILVNTGGYLFAWIGFAEHKEGKGVRPMASAGNEAGYLSEVSVSWADDEPTGGGPIGRAIRTGKPQFSRNTAQDQNFAPWRNPALRRGFHSVAALPLHIAGRIQGTLALYSQEDSFDEEEVDLLSKLAANLAFGLTSLRTRRERDEKQALLQQNAHQLHERFKELNLLYTISRLKNRDDVSTADILTRIAEAIPRAWQFPDIAAACIQTQNYGDFKTSKYTESNLSMSRPVLLDGKDVGRVDVAYIRNVAGDDDSIFLPEEGTLLDTVAYHVAEIIRKDQIEAEKRKLSGALEQTADTVVITDKEGVIEYVNPSFEDNTGFSRQEAIGQKPNILKSGEHPPEFYQAMWETILQGKVYRDTVINRTKSGSLVYEYKTITPLYDQQGRLTHFLATGKDLTEQLHTESRLQYLASHDPLTGLMNYTEFIRHLEQDINELSDSQKKMAVAIIGMDKFKAVNETMGRLTGDRILKRFGQRLSQNTSMQWARLEGDKFGCIIHGVEPSQAGVLIQDLLDQLAQPLKAGQDDEEVVVTATAGISSYPSDAGQGVELVELAEIAMSRAKESGIQRFEFYTPDMQVNSLGLLRRNKELLDALEEGQFTLYYQPQIDLVSGRISGAEALVRWEHPEGHIIGPQEFIPLLEDMGRIGELGDFVLRQACTVLERITKAGLELPRMAVNLAAPQLEDPDLGSKITNALKATGLPAHKLELEVTESLLISRYEQVQEGMNQLLSMGIGVALDDFGTGYSSLQYLTRYPFSKLKIDKSFVWKMGSGDKEHEVVKAIISLGKSLKIRVLAEGVENDGHVRTLRELGCEAVQGFLYSPPVDEQAFIAYVHRHSGTKP